MSGLTQVCEKCFRAQELCEFPFGQPTNGQWICDACTRLSRSLAKRKRAAMDQARERVLPMRKVGDVNLGLVADAARAVVEAFGGLEEMAAGLVAQVKAAAESDPGSTRAINGYNNAFRLLMEAAQAMAEIGKVDRVSDEELALQVARIYRSGGFQELMQNEDEEAHPRSRDANPDGAGLEVPAIGSSAQARGIEGVPAHDGGAGAGPSLPDAGDDRDRWESERKKF